MPATPLQRELMVFPTELSLRRFQQEQALRQGWVDASGHTTFARLRRLCLPYACLKGRRLSPAKEWIIRKQVVEVARGHFVAGGPLGQLSDAALGDVLKQLLKELAVLPESVDPIIDWMLSRSDQHKLYQLGMLFSVWRTIIGQEGLVDPLDVNVALLRLLKGKRQNWPPLLRDAKKITFRSVRWFNPFEEACVVALNHTMKVRVESALPLAHAEGVGDRLGQQVRAEIMSQPWAVWAEDLGDALAVDSPDVLHLDNAERMAFSRSAGAYGEIEDLARRIRWNLEKVQRPPHRIALVVPNMGSVQDIIPHVFSRFQIPYYFRRGRPVLSSACVKAFLAWLAFPLTATRDGLVDLIRNPALNFEHREAAVKALLKQPPRLDLNTLPGFRERETISGMQAARLLAEQIVEPEDHFNTEALAAVAAMLEELGDVSMPLHDLIDLLEELLENATIRPRDSHEQGVWVLNPHDAVGLNFDLVLFAGLNEGEFPSIPQQDALLSDHERSSLWKHLEGPRRSLPKLALPSVDVLFEQESVLFLTALGMAREQLVLSYQAVDQEGHEKSAGEYYRKLWNLAHHTLTPYDEWRIAQLGGVNLFSTHWRAQQNAPSEERIPMPGESFLPLIPWPLCCARDETLQAAVQWDWQAPEASDPLIVPASNASAADESVKHLVEMLNMERERRVFLETPDGERVGSKYCGHIGLLKEKVAAWFEQKKTISPTALEGLAQSRYIFLLEKVFEIYDPRWADDTPDPMDRGGLIHSILEEVYSAIAGGTAGIEAPRYWAVESAAGWIKRTEGGTNALPLATFAPELEASYVEFARQVAERRMNETLLGHPGVWAAEREKVLEIVLNFVRYDAATCAAENRFPARFEQPFSDLAIPGIEPLSVRGKMDRVDLIFAETGALERVRVLDYKGPSRARSNRQEYVDEIQRNLDCQLPIYAFAAEQYFFGTLNVESTRARIEVGYLFYQRELKEVRKTLSKSLIPMDEPGMIAAFLETLAENIHRLKAGDFAVDPLVAGYTDYQSVCRTTAVDRGDLE